MSVASLVCRCVPGAPVCPDDVILAPFQHGTTNTVILCKARQNKQHKFSHVGIEKNGSDNPDDANESKDNHLQQQMNEKGGNITTARSECHISSHVCTRKCDVNSDSGVDVDSDVALFRPVVVHLFGSGTGKIIDRNTEFNVLIELDHS